MVSLRGLPPSTPRLTRIFKIDIFPKHGSAREVGFRVGLRLERGMEPGHGCVLLVMMRPTIRRLKNKPHPFELGWPRKRNLRRSTGSRTTPTGTAHFQMKQSGSTSLEVTPTSRRRPSPGRVLRPPKSPDPSRHSYHSQVQSLPRSRSFEIFTQILGVFL